MIRINNKWAHLLGCLGFVLVASSCFVAVRGDGQSDFGPFVVCGDVSSTDLSLAGQECIRCNGDSTFGPQPGNGGGYQAAVYDCGHIIYAHWQHHFIGGQDMAICLADQPMQSGPELCANIQGTVLQNPATK